jgi:hypothetical protein
LPGQRKIDRAALEVVAGAAAEVEVDIIATETEAIATATIPTDKERKSINLLLNRRFIYY